MLKSDVRRNMEKSLEILAVAKRVTMVGHVHADGDVYGSLSAFHDRLQGRVERVLPLVFESIPPRYAFLNLDHKCGIFNPEDAAMKDTILGSDLLIALDLALPERLPGWEEILARFEGDFICIDHHPRPENPLGSLHIIDTGVCATGQLLYEMFRMEGGRLTREQALGIYTAIATDTGWFRYANTKPEILGIAAELLQNDIDPAEIYGYIYQRNGLKKMKLLGQLLSGIQSELDGKFLWTSLSRRAMEACQVEDLETEDLLDLLRSIDGSRCIALFRETQDNGIRVNLRSKGSLFINGIARRFGGGGHPRAAGITVKEGKLQEVEQEIVKAIIAFMAGEGRKDEQ